jgi:hypothetical protein
MMIFTGSFDEQWHYFLVSITRGCDNMCTFCGPALPVDGSSRTPEHHEGNSGFMGQSFKKSPSWTM